MSYLCSFILDYSPIHYFFFFQAEDGIRDAQESRGLGDVYKRQQEKTVKSRYTVFHQCHLTLDMEGQQPAAGLHEVIYHTPQQGFRNEWRKGRGEHFGIRYGPCWGRPHVTVDVVLTRRGEDGERVVLRDLWSCNLPRTDQSFKLELGPQEVVQPVEEEEVVDVLEEALSQKGEEIADHLLCPITYAAFVDPVVCMDGHTYEREAIEEWLKHHDTSPLTNAVLPSRMVVPNYALLKELDMLREQARQAV
eukprot:TRINITY_DN29106_c0_g1_i1.p1 TRINITY_DN29106_c0_g1~~TRINITY_DN29106_c0_g1_i1.p1  ORF type:complete len:249 (+),score=53.32 TRINITY_DN29106_c0_g1_i1:82-828(+)